MTLFASCDFLLLAGYSACIRYSAHHTHVCYFAATCYFIVLSTFNAVLCAAYSCYTYYPAAYYSARTYYSATYYSADYYSALHYSALPVIAAPEPLAHYIGGYAEITNWASGPNCQISEFISDAQKWTGMR